MSVVTIGKDITAGSNKHINRASRDVGFKALGTQITFNNDASNEIQNLVGRLWKGFNCNRTLLSAKHLPYARRLIFLQRIAEGSMWAASSLNLTLKHCQQLRAAQQTMLRSVIGCKAFPNELTDDFHERWGKKIKYWTEFVGFVGFDELYYRAVNNWAGHLARLPIWRGHSIAASVLDYRDARYLKRIVQRHGSQMHGKCVHAWRWERAVTMKWGHGWRKTMCKEDWKEEAKNAANWRTRT